MDATLARSGEWVVVVAHGGVLMAALETFARPGRPYFQWTAPAGVGLRWRRTRGSGDGNTPCNSQELWYGKGGERC
ncbi:MAG: hypothetical protein ACLTYN_03910 [Dysosmobacter welbionis]